MTTAPTLSKRDQLVQTASRLFAAQGYRGTGIDQIASEAKVTKKTMYHHFASKDDLIVAVLENYQASYLREFKRQVEACSPDPQERLLGIFVVAEKWFRRGDFHGCLFINAVAEYSAPDAPLRAIGKSFKRLEREYMEQLATAAGADNPRRLAASLAILFEGAIVTAQVSGPAAARAATEAAKVIIAAELAG